MSDENKSRLHGGNVRSGAGGNYGSEHLHSSTADAVTQASASQPVRAATGRVIGRVVGDVFIKRARASVHMLRTPRGWALETTTLAELRAAGVVTVTVTDTETGTTYSAPLTEFDAHGVAFNRGFGPQVVLPLGYWRVNGQPPALAPRQPDPDAPRQLTLFAEEGAS